MSITSRVSGLLHVPPPVLTAYLDVSPGNPRNQSTPRGYIKWLKSAGQALNNQLPPSARKEFRKQLDRVNEYVLVNELISGQETRQSVTGLDQTLDRLQRGEVRELVVARGLKGVVQQCLNCGWADRTADAVCPICDSKRQSRTLLTLLPELANLQSVPMEVVAGEAARKLRAAGGIGAWLRAARIPSRRKTNIPLFSRAG